MASAWMSVPESTTSLTCVHFTPQFRQAFGRNSRAWWNQLPGTNCPEPIARNQLPTRNQLPVPVHGPYARRVVACNAKGNPTVSIAPSEHPPSQKIRSENCLSPVPQCPRAPVPQCLRCTRFLLTRCNTAAKSPLNLSRKSIGPTPRNTRRLPVKLCRPATPMLPAAKAALWRRAAQWLREAVVGINQLPVP